MISALWADDVVEHDGEWSSFTPSWSLPKPRQAGHRRPGPPILIGAAAGPKTFEHVLELADGWYPLTGPSLLDDTARLRALAAERGVATEVTAVEMGGQFPGAPWYFRDAGARRQLFDDARRYADGGVDRLSVGVPVDTAGRARGRPRRARRAAAPACDPSHVG